MFALQVSGGGTTSSGDFGAGEAGTRLIWINFSPVSGLFEIC